MLRRNCTASASLAPSDSHDNTPQRRTRTETNRSYLIRILIFVLTPLRTDDALRRSGDTTGDQCTKPVEAF